MRPVTGEATIDGIEWWTSVIVVPIAALLALQIWAFVDAATVPSDRWRRIGQRKALWLVLIWLSSGLGAVYYGLRLRRRLRRDPSATSI